MTAPTANAAFSVLFFCMGNICRSPTAHGVFRHKLRQRGLEDVVRVDSAGTHNYHPGDPPDRRSQRAAALRGYDLSDLRARQVSDDDFERHDLLLGMDWDNIALAEERCPPKYRRKLKRLAEYCRRHPATVVPDPYYGGDAGFTHVLDLIEDACDSLLDDLSRRLHGRASEGGAQ